VEKRGEIGGNLHYNFKRKKNSVRNFVVNVLDQGPLVLRVKIDQDGGKML